MVYPVPKSVEPVSIPVSINDVILSVELNWFIKIRKVLIRSPDQEL